MPTVQVERKGQEGKAQLSRELPLHQGSAVLARHNGLRVALDPGSYTFSVAYQRLSPLESQLKVEPTPQRVVSLSSSWLPTTATPQVGGCLLLVLTRNVRRL